MTSLSKPFRATQYSRMLTGLGAFIVLGIAVSVGAVFGDVVRSAVLGAGLVVLAVAVRRTRLTVRIDATGVGVAEAHIAWVHVSGVEALDEVQMRAAITTDARPNDYLRIRGTRAGIRLWLDDATDPHRCWVVSVPDRETAASALRAFAGERVRDAA